jgi:hypothetical protein
MLVGIAATCAAALIAFQTPAAQSDGQMGGGGFGEIEAPGDPALTLPLGVAVGQAVGVLAARHPYTFYPQAGVQGWDLAIDNYVDLNTTSYDITKPGLDFECTEYSYQGHNGHDSVIDGFREQSIGVPIFAALDGTVTATHDGEADDNVTNVVGRAPNYVTVSHAGGFYTQYLHMKRGSVAVSVGQTVAAGRQLGLTGSSGNSSWPHLHFTSFQGNTSFEPNAGRCRPGSTYWMNQPGINRDPWASSFTFGAAGFTGDDGYPYDQVNRMGTYVRGATTIYFRFTLHHLPTQSNYRLSVRRPDGSTALDNSGAFNNTSIYKHP